MPDYGGGGYDGGGYDDDDYGGDYKSDMSYMNEDVYDGGGGYGGGGKTEVQVSQVQT